MRVQAGIVLLSALLLSACDTPQKAADGTTPAAKPPVSDRYVSTGSRVPSRSTDQQSPDVQSSGGEGYQNAVRGQSTGMGGGYSPH